METTISSQFYYKGKPRPAQFFLSLDGEGGYVFTILKDPELIERFGCDVDFQTDGEQPILNTTIIDPEYYELQTAILETIKQLPPFIQGRPLLSQGRVA